MSASTSVRPCVRLSVELPAAAREGDTDGECAAGPACGRRSLRVVPFLPLNPLEAKDMGTQLAGVVPTPPKF